MNRPMIGRGHFVDVPNSFGPSDGPQNFACRACGAEFECRYDETGTRVLLPNTPDAVHRCGSLLGRKAVEFYAVGPD